MGCSDCKLDQHCHRPRIQGRGNIDNPKLIILGMCPGQDEDDPDSGGSVFIGPAGQELSKALGKWEDDVYITNVVKCCPHSDIITMTGIRDPSPQEIECCKSILMRELSIFSNSTPIMTLGNIPLTAICGDHAGITKEAGNIRIININGKEFKVIPNFHPSYIIRNVNQSHENLFHHLFVQTLSGDAEDEYLIATPEQAMDLTEKIIIAYENKKIEYVLVDTETTGLNPWIDKVIMYSLDSPDIIGPPMSAPLVIQNVIHHQNFPYPISTIPWEVSDKERLSMLKVFGRMMETVPIAGHNIKYDIDICCFNNICNFDKIRPYADTLPLSELAISRTMFGDLQLKTLCTRLFSIPDWEVIIKLYLSRFKRVVDRTYANVPTSLLGKYACFDAKYNNSLLQLVFDTITPQQGHIKEILISLTKIYAEAEVKGVRIDEELLLYLDSSYLDMIKSLKAQMLTIIPEWTAKKVEKMASRFKKPRYIDPEIVFNPGSTPDKQSILFDHFKLKPLKNSEKTGNPSCDAESLDNIYNGLQDGTPKDFLKNLIEYGNHQSIYSKYIHLLPEKTIDGICHPDYNINGTITGRLTSWFHSMPRKSDVKRLFISRWRNSGGLIVSADFSQLELRVLAAIADEQTWIEGFKNGIDAHLNTASLIFGIPPNKITKEQRSIGKTINFGMVFGLTDAGLASRINKSTKEAKALKQTLFQNATKLQPFLQSMHDFVRVNGFIITKFNRKIPIIAPDIEAAERRAANYIIQSSASDTCQSTIVRIYNEFKARDMKSIIIGNVHDSIVIDIYPGELVLALGILKRHCEIENQSLYDWLICPLTIDIGIGSSWGSAVDLKVEFDVGITNFRGSGFRKDIATLRYYSDDVYNWQMKIETEEEITEWDMDTLIRDRVKQTVVLSTNN